MRSPNVLAPVLAAGLLVAGCSAENTNTISPADAQLISAYTSCQLESASAENSAVKREGFPRVDVGVIATKNTQPATEQIHYGNLIGRLLRNGSTKALAELAFGWQTNSDGSKSQTNAYEVPNLDLFTESFNGREPLFQHEVIAIYATAQNNSHTQPKNSQRYCGEIVIGQVAPGILYANVVQPLTPPETLRIENGFGNGDIHCQIVC